MLSQENPGSTVSTAHAQPLAVAAWAACQHSSTRPWVKPKWPKRLTRISNYHSVAFCSPAKSLAFSRLMENPLVGKKLKS